MLLFFSSSHTCVVETLSNLNIPVVEASAGIFVFADLSSFLESHDFESEKILLRNLFESAGLLFTPGESCHAQSPGFFRICYAWVSYDILKVAMNRLEIFVNTLRTKNSCLI